MAFAYRVFRSRVSFSLNAMCGSCAPVDLFPVVFFCLVIVSLAFAIFCIDDALYDAVAHFDVAEWVGRTDSTRCCLSLLYYRSGRKC